eukprot:TRINITY_DN59021_c0_g1_i1.p1 TRINITY_DN59021_c0_g1~~TRINITY_DN59021_c0_g1_i1.p1  ORF type:complete len:337 (+),score=28.16 TRINITY_DN59021_c0_g1_i1:25-1011(+)
MRHSTKWHILVLTCRSICFVQCHDDKSTLRAKGGILPKINSDTWLVWQPPSDFAAEFASWPDPGLGDIPEEVRVWCKGFISTNVSSAVVEGHSVMPIQMPGGLSPPGYKGQCAVIDGRSWTSTPFDGQRPTDARFAARLGVWLGEHGDVEALARCGYSHNLCCVKNGCNGIPYGNYTCGPLHCPDDRMQVRRLRCWTKSGVRKNGWTLHGENCSGAQNVLAVKVYFYGRGGDPCVAPLGVPSPPASWDIGVLMFPTKRRVWLTGFVDDAPATECYAQSRGRGIWNPPVTLVQLSSAPGNIAKNIVGFSDRPVNPLNLTVTLQDPYVVV